MTVEWQHRGLPHIHMPMLDLMENGTVEEEEEEEDDGWRMMDDGHQLMKTT